MTTSEELKIKDLERTPPIIQQAVENLLNGKNGSQITNNYRNQLDIIRCVIEFAINEYDRRKGKSIGDKVGTDFNSNATRNRNRR